MSTPLSRTLRSLEADRPTGAWLAGVAGAALLAGWAVWMFEAEVPVFAATDNARIEAGGAVYPIEAQAGGRVLEIHLTSGELVEAGQLLLELDSSEEVIEREELRAREESLALQLEATRGEIAVEEEMAARIRAARDAAHDEARAEAREAMVSARLAKQELNRTNRLSRVGAVAEADRQTALAQAAQRRLTAERLNISVTRSRLDQGVVESEGLARLQRLQASAAEIAATLATVRGRLRRIELVIERRRLVAPVAGRVGEVGELRVGSFVEPGYRCAVVVADGLPKIVASFRPEEAFGRIERGQRAELRLHAYPWLQYGSVSGTVTAVASERRDGSVRVELDPDPVSRSAVPLTHGLPGTLEIEVARSSPARLVLRAAGIVLGSPIERADAARAGEPPD